MEDFSLVSFGSQDLRDPGIPLQSEGLHDLSSIEIRCLEFPQGFDRQIVIAFFAFNLPIVSAGESVCESMAGKLYLPSRVMSQWEIHGEVFRTRGFSRI